MKVFTMRFLTKLTALSTMAMLSLSTAHASDATSPTEQRAYRSSSLNMIDGTLTVRPRFGCMFSVNLSGKVFEESQGIVLRRLIGKISDLTGDFRMILSGYEIPDNVSLKAFAEDTGKYDSFQHMLAESSFLRIETPKSNQKSTQ
jgi:hypothetical protein